MKLTLVRHARSIANDVGIRQGKDDEWRDTPLHEKGEKQAEVVSRELSKQKFDLIYSSPLKRTKQTAEAIAKYHNAKIILDERLIERSDAEPMAEVIKRAKDFLDEIKQTDKNILAVSHNGIILTLLAISTGKREAGKKIAKKYMKKLGNTSISKLTWDGEKFHRSVIASMKHREDKD